MKKRILMSLLTIGIVGALIGGGVTTYFSDIETAEDNVFTAGTLDIEVDGQNPWEGKFIFEDVKPCEVEEIDFIIHNVGQNPCHIWKHIEVTDQHGGKTVYPHPETGPASSEPEYEEGGGFDGVYVERCNLAAYILYDLSVQYDRFVADDECKDFGSPQWIFPADMYVRVDNIDCTWVYLGVLYPSECMLVHQSYHLDIWPDAVEEEITNWAQGDVMEFDITLYAAQLTAPSPLGASPSMTLENKDPITWAIITGDGISGTLNYNAAGPTFNYSFSGVAPVANANYELIYYVDPWPGTGGCSIGTGHSSAADGSISFSGTPDLGMDMFNAKIWLVLDADYNGTSMTAWNPSSYLFETAMINYNDTDV